MVLLKYKNNHFVPKTIICYFLPKVSINLNKLSVSKHFNVVAFKLQRYICPTVISNSINNFMLEISLSLLILLSIFWIIIVDIKIRSS